MGAHEHREEGKAPVTARVLVVSSTRTEATDTSGKYLASALGEAGHEVLSVEIVDDDIGAIESAARAYATDGRTRALLITGGTGLSRRDVTVEAIGPLLTRELPGFGELFRMLSYEEVGAAAMLSRAIAGVAGPLVIFALPGSASACRLALTKLVLPELSHICHQLAKEGSDPLPSPPSVEVDLSVEFDEDHYPIHDEETFGGAADDDDREDFVEHRDEPQATQGIELAAAQPAAGVRAVGEQGPWQRWIANQGGFVTRHKRYDLPDHLEAIAPFVQVLHQAGQQAVLQLPNGRKYSIWGFPDLDRPNAKVLAVGWGQPYGEVLALHRYPHVAGTCMDGSTGQVPARSSNVASICEAVTGTSPRDCEGTLFAVAADAVWFESGGSVMRWDGRKLSDEGFPKQVLARLALHWSTR